MFSTCWAVDYTNKFLTHFNIFKKIMISPTIKNILTEMHALHNRNPNNTSNAFFTMRLL